MQALPANVHISRCIQPINFTADHQGSNFDANNLESLTIMNGVISRDECKNFL